MFQIDHGLDVMIVSSAELLAASLKLSISLEHVLECDKTLKDLVFVTHRDQNLTSIVDKHFLKLRSKFVFTKKLKLLGSRCHERRRRDAVLSLRLSANLDFRLVIPVCDENVSVFEV